MHDKSLAIDKVDKPVRTKKPDNTNYHKDILC